MKDRTEQSPLNCERDGTDATTADRRKSAPKRPPAESTKGTAERDLMEQIVHPDNLNAAWEQVRRNHGAPGVDGITIEAFPAFLGPQQERLRKALIGRKLLPGAGASGVYPKTRRHGAAARGAYSAGSPDPAGHGTNPEPPVR